MSLSEEERQVIVDYRIEKCSQTMQEARECAELKHYSLAVQRLYYAVYYIVTAVLIKRGIPAQTHAGVRNMFHKELVLTGVLSADDGRLYGRLMQMRHTGDYDDLFDYTKDDVDYYLPKAEALIEKIRQLI